MRREERALRKAKLEWNAERSSAALADSIMLFGTVGLVLLIIGMIVSAL